MSEVVSGNVIPKYWMVFIIRDILNCTEGVTRHYVILRVSMTCGKVQDQRDVAGKIRAITNKDSMPGLWLPVR